MDRTVSLAVIAAASQLAVLNLAGGASARESLAALGTLAAELVDPNKPRGYLVAKAASALVSLATALEPVSGLHGHSSYSVVGRPSPFLRNGVTDRHFNWLHPSLFPPHPSVRH